MTLERFDSHNKLSMPVFNTEFIEKFKNSFHLTDSGCKEWTGKKKRCGHGYVYFNYKTYLCHRIAYFLYYGNLDKTLQINHKCNNPACIEPTHLYQGTPRQNNLDAVKFNTSGTVNINDIEQIKSDFASGETIRNIAMKYKVNKYTIRNIVNALSYNDKDELPMWVSKASKNTYKYSIQINGIKYFKCGFIAPEDAYQAALEIKNGHSK